MGDQEAGAVVETTIDERGIARVTLDRPEVRNALDETLIARLTETFERLDRDPAVRCILLTGAGKAFCAGGDLNWMRRTADYDYEDNFEDAQRLGRLLYTVDTVSRPTVALVNGAAFGGGVGLVACCDIAVATEGAKFSLSEVRLGLAPATISPYVLRKLGTSNARRLFLTAEVFEASAARGYGLVHEVVAPDTLEATGEAFVDLLLKGGPAAQAMSKELVAHVAGQRIDDDLIDWTAQRIAEIRATEEGKEGASAFLWKRPPNWQVAADEGHSEG